MAKIQFRVRDGENKVIVGATLEVFCNLKNGELWRSEQFITDNSGVVWMTLPNPLMRRLNLQTMKLDIRYKEQPLTHRFTQPERINRDGFIIYVTVRRPNQQADDGPQPAPDEGKQPQAPAPTPEIVKPPLPRDEQPEPPTPEKPPSVYEVSGKILTANGRFDANRTVVAFDRDICDETILGQAKSGKDGSYRIQYKPEQLAEKERARANLIVRVFADDNVKEDALATSPLIIRAGVKEIVNLSTGTEQYRGLSTYERLEDTLRPYLEKKVWDCITTEDIWLLADRTGLRRAAIAQFVRARLMADRFGTTNTQKESLAVILFALLKSGMSPNLNSLTRHSDHLLAAKIRRARAQNWIPVVTDAEKIINDIRQPRAGLLLENDANSQLLFNLAGLDNAQKQQLVQHLLQEEELTAGSWQKLAHLRGFNNAIVKQVQDATRMNALLGGNARLLRAAQRDFEVREPRHLARLTQPDLEKLIAAELPQLPDTLPGDNENERVYHMATAVRHNIETQYPTDTFSHSLRADKALAAPPVEAFFAENPDFDFTRSSVRQQLSGRTGPVIDKQREQLSQIESLFHIAPPLDKYEHVKALWEAGYKSAQDVARHDRRAFRKAVAPSVGGTQVADQIFARAQHAWAYELTLATQLQTQTNGLSLAVLPSATLQAKSGQANLEDLFQLDTVTQCNHCQSALSPSAYLVDLLDFLSRASDADGKSGLIYLRERRSDIEQLELDCANSENVLPYIDLVLEILENVVAPSPAGFEPQTGRDTAELLAQPERTNFRAYEPLTDAIYPWNLPFDLHTALTRAYLAQLGVPHHELLRTLYAFEESGPAIRQAAGALLGLTSEQIALVSNPADDRQFRILWGFDKNQIDSQLPDVEALLSRSQLPFEEITELLETRFVNPDNLVIIGEGGQLQNLSVDLLDRLYRLSRLHAWTAISVADLDTMLGCLTITQLSNSTFIMNLAALVQLHSDGGFSYGEMAQWWVDPANLDRDLFAAALDTTATTLTQLERSTDGTLATPVDAHKCWQHVTRIAETGFSLTELLDLLSPPSDTSQFSLGGAETLLLNLQAVQQALLATINTDAPPPDLAQQLLDISYQHLADAWGVDRNLLPTLATQPAGNQPPLADILATTQFTYEESFTNTIKGRLILMRKQALLFSRLHLNINEFNAIVDAAPTMDLLPINNLASIPGQPGQTVDTFLRLVDSEAVNVQHFINDESLYTCVSRYRAESRNVSELQATIATDTDWSEDTLSFLFGPSGFNWKTPAQFFNDNGLLRLHQATHLADRLGMSAADTWEFTITSVNQSHELYDVLVAKYTAETWLAVAKQLHDPLREKQRDALLATIINQDPTFNDALDVYTHYLIDVEMSACYETSRIKQANASVQQLIQRILLNLEPGLSFSPENASEWRWRKNYRVWEANRKVFLYPENWVEPALRDNKTMFFTELESQLLQDEVRADTAEAALMSFARKLHAVSNLEIAALLKDDDSGIVYVFGRTRDLPHTYYLCRRSNAGVWTGWENVDLDIDSNHLLPVIYNRHLHLFWPSFDEKLDDKNDAYLTELAQIETSISSIESEIQSLKQSVKDLENLVAEYEEMSQQYGGMYTTMFANFNSALSGVNATLDTEEGNLIGKRKEKELLIQRYTYLELALTWSRQDSQENWLPSKKSADFIESIYTTIVTSYTWVGDIPVPIILENRQYFYNREDILFETAISEENQLTIAVQQPSEFSEVDAPGSRPLYVFGHFVFDVCTNALSAVPEKESVVRAELLNDSEPISQKLHVTADHLKLSTLTTSGANRQQTLFDTFDGSPRTAVYQPVADDDDKLAILGVEDGRSFIALRTLKHLSPKVNDLLLPGTAFDLGKGKLNPPTVTEPKGADFLPPEIHRDTSPVFSNHEAKNMAIVRSKDQLVEGGQTLNTGQLDNLNVSHGTLPDIDFSDLLTSPIEPDAGISVTPLLQNNYQYRLYACYHPYTCLFITQLSRYGLEGLYLPDADSDDPDMQAMVRQTTPAADPDYFDKIYDPTGAIKQPHPQEIITFAWEQPFAIYNWELFFHAPLLIAVRLTQEQRFEEAQDWLHYIFDPTIPADDGNTAGYWRFGPFFDEQQAIESSDYQRLLELAESGAAAFNAQVAAWEDNPFNPHAVARLRIVAYMRATVMKYLDNLLAWGDHLFRRDTMESLNEALQIYALAAQILGAKPIILDSAGESANPPTAVQVLNGVSAVNATLTFAAAGKATESTTNTGTSFLNTLLTFCLPPNGKLLGYWDTVADRLFKLRHCMNIDGIVRKLPLYEPPIDPALLVRAAAAGVDLQTAVAGLSATLPHYRFRYVLQKALEFTNDVKSLGNTLLTILEKQDAEALALLRGNNEVTLLEAILNSKQLLIDEAKTNLEAAQARQAMVRERYDYYADRERLDKNEKAQMALLGTALGFQYASTAVSLAASIAYLFPQIYIGPVPKAGHGGLHVGQSLSAWSGFAGSVAQSLNMTAGMAASTAQYNRRAEEWDFQAEQAQVELEQTEKQIISTEIRIALAEAELANQELKIEQSEEAQLFMQDKFTNQELYSWMIGEITTLYFQAYQLAYDMAKQAETAYRHELGIDDASFIQYGYWDSLKKGLLAGEKLSLDLRRMETAYMNNHVRERELTKHVSLTMLNPAALLQLKETGTCQVTIPEALFDLDFPGHYFRRIKSVSLTVPAVTGPYTTLGCTLTLESSQIRRTADVDTTPVDESVGQYQSIATSSGQTDSGVFQLDFRDERYLPFEGAGAISTWQLRLTNPALAQFDYNTINDVIFHIRYTAREASDATFRTDVTQSLLDNLTSLLGTDGYLSQLLSVRNHFPDEWARLLAADDENEHTLAIQLNSTFFPYLMGRRTIQIFGFTILTASTGNGTAIEVSLTSPDHIQFGPANLLPDEDMPEVIAATIDLETNRTTPTPKSLGLWQVMLSDDLVSLLITSGSSNDLILICKYSVG